MINNVCYRSLNFISKKFNMSNCRLLTEKQIYRTCIVWCNLTFITLVNRPEPNFFFLNDILSKYSNSPENIKWPHEQSWPWSYGSWIYNYLCNQYLLPLMLWVRISIRATTLCLSATSDRSMVYHVYVY